MIKRELYLTKLQKFKDTPFIKVLTGMRRAGKSTLLDLFIAELLADGVPDSQIIKLNFELLAFADITDYRTLYARIKEKMVGQSHIYLFLDEVQLVDGWERAVNSLFAEGCADIYITGSNARLLSSEIATLLSGRYVELTVYPLSFQEYMLFAPADSNIDDAFQNYLRFGGMPVVPSLQPDTIPTILGSITDTALIKDVVQRNKVRDVTLLEAIIRYLADNIGSPISSKKVSGYLTSTGRKTNANTIDSYLKMLEDAFIFYSAQRYDVKGKLYLRSQEKYYIVDNGIRNALLGFKGGDFGHVLENIVFLELKRRGYTVGVGKLDRLEIDFVATRPEEKIYFQVSYSLVDETTRSREIAPLLAIPDNYKKVILTMDRTYIHDYEGIDIVNIVDFLLEN